MKDTKQSNIDLTHLNIKAPLIRVQDASVLKVIKRSINVLDIKPKQLAFLNASIKKCLSHSEQITSLEEVSQTLGFSMSTIRNYAKYFLDIGLFEQSYCTTDEKKNRRGVLYDLKAPETSISLSKDGESKAAQAQLIRVEDVDIVNSDDLKDAAFCDLITTVLFGSLRFNQKASQAKIESFVLWQSEKVKVTTRSGKGEKIALLKDLRYYIALITVLEHIIKEKLSSGLEVGETYNIPLNSVLSVLSLPKSGGNKSQALKGIRRLSGTSFHMNKLPSWFLQRYNMSENSVLHLNILNLRVEGESKEVPGSVVLQIQFPSETVAQIIKRFDSSIDAYHELTETQPYALSVKNNLIFAFNLWSSAYFKSKGLAVMGWPELKDRIAPQISLTDFKKNFSIILKNHASMASMWMDFDDVGSPIEEEDDKYERVYQGGVAMQETAVILGVKITVNQEEIVLMPEIKKHSSFTRNLAPQFMSQQKKKKV